MSATLSRPQCVNTLRPRQNGRYFADDMFKYIFLNENVWILIENSLKFVPKGSINNNPALCQIMAWRRPGDKPLFESMMVSSLTHICVTRPQWVKLEHYRISMVVKLNWMSQEAVDRRVQNNSTPALVQMIVWCRIGDRSLSDPMINLWSCIYMCVCVWLTICGVNFVVWIGFMDATLKNFSIRENFNLTKLFEQYTLTGMMAAQLWLTASKYV